MMPTSDLIATLREGAQGVDFTVRFLILDACDRLERKTKDNELLAQKIVELRSRTVKTNADRIRAMSDQELAVVIMCPMEIEDKNAACDKGLAYSCVECSLQWLQEPAKEVKE